jgi:hypothetical protein
VILPGVVVPVAEAMGVAGEVAGEVRIVVFVE